MDLVSRLVAQGGAARAVDLAPTGAARRRLAAAVAAGEVMRRGGCYHLPGCADAIVAARAVDGALTCVSAAQVHGLGLLVPAEPHIAVAAHRNVRHPGAVIHREPPSLLTADVHPLLPDGPAVVRPAEALARLLRCQEPLAAIATVDSALNRRVTTVTEIASLLTGPGSPLARRTLGECDGRSQSVLESVARVVLRRGGLRVEPNVRVDGVGFVDLLVEDRVVVELDGFGYHGDRRAFRDDRRRDRELLAQGYLVLRFTWEDVVRDPDAVRRAVLAVLRPA